MAIWSIHNTPVNTLVYVVIDKSRGNGKLEYRIFESVEGAKARKANTREMTLRVNAGGRAVVFPRIRHKT